jgi:glycosyltransferase involved in cell wall biosynthesis
VTELRITHVITGLATGGAEILLVRVLERLAGGPISGEVIALRDHDTLGSRIEALGVAVQTVGMGSPPGPASVARLRRALRASRADVVQTWLLHANVIGGLVSRASIPAPIAWGVHITEVDAASFGRVAAVLQRAERRLASRVPRAIIACSESSAVTMRRLGYPEDKLATIPNGFDTHLLHPDAADRDAVRAEFGISAGEIVVGHASRWHPAKDHATLLAAAKKVADEHPTVRFVLCGRGLDPANAELASLASPLGDRVVLAGERTDLPRVMRGFDVFAFSSAGEALPLVIGEAMASGVPVVSTDTGDSPYLIGNSGRVVPVRDPESLARAIGEIVSLPGEDRLRLGAAARERIEATYTLDGMVDAYVGVWRRLASSNAA